MIYAIELKMEEAERRTRETEINGMSPLLYLLKKKKKKKDQSNLLPITVLIFFSLIIQVMENKKFCSKGLRPKHCFQMKAYF